MHHMKEDLLASSQYYVPVACCPAAGINEMKPVSFRTASTELVITQTFQYNRPLDRSFRLQGHWTEIVTATIPHAAHSYKVHEH